MDELTSFRASVACSMLQGILANYQKDSEAAVVSVAETIIQVCEDHSYAYERIFQLKEIGALPSNRDNEGCTFTRAHSRASKIKGAGCSKATLEKNAVATEDDPRTRYIAKYTASLQFIDVRYARYREKDVRI